MNTHRYVIRIDSDIDAIGRLLSIRPATWLRSFLLLSLHGLKQNHPQRDLRTVLLGPRGEPWYRLAPQAEAKGMSARLTWWPHEQNLAVFERFEGQLFGELAADGSTQLGIEGRTAGGETDTTQLVLNQLLLLIGSAITATPW